MNNKAFYITIQDSENFDKNKVVILCHPSRVEVLNKMLDIVDSEIEKLKE